MEEIIIKEFSYEIKDPVGIHARPAGLLVREAGKYSSEITIIKDGKEADAKKLFGVMGLAVKQDDKVTVRISGDDEETAAENLEKFFKENL